MCRHYNPNHLEKCDHEMAEPAREVDVANFCHYFRAAEHAYKPDEKQRADDALNQLKALFGETASQAEEEARDNQDAEVDPDRAKFEELFKKND
jgi:hypothetical protein